MRGYGAGLRAVQLQPAERKEGTEQNKAGQGAGRNRGSPSAASQHKKLSPGAHLAAAGGAEAVVVPLQRGAAPQALQHAGANHQKVAARQAQRLCSAGAASNGWQWAGQRWLQGAAAPEDAREHAAGRVRADRKQGRPAAAATPASKSRKRDGPARTLLGAQPGGHDEGLGVPRLGVAVQPLHQQQPRVDVALLAKVALLQRALAQGRAGGRGSRGVGAAGVAASQQGGQALRDGRAAGR